MLSPFRGITAPASLKPPHGGRARSDRFPFRGITAPASLKHIASPSGVHVLIALPGHNSPGLIEAALMSGSS